MKKSRKRQVYILGLLLMACFFLTGCVRYDQAGNPGGWVYTYFGHPSAQFLNWLSSIFGGSYGLAIIIVTLITRLFMLPSTMKMTKDTMVSQAKMKIAQPEIDEIKAEIDATDDPQEKAALNNEMMAVYKKYNISMLGGLSGCLPLLIQMPIISAVYAAIRSSKEIKNATFLTIPLGERSYTIVILVILVTALQGWLMQKNTAHVDNPQVEQTNKSMMLINPLMLGYFSYMSSAGLGLYFLAGGVFMIIQQLYMNKKVRPRIEAQIAENMTEIQKKTSQGRPRKASQKFQQDSQNKRLVPTKQNRQKGPRRNEGAQQRRRKK